MLFLTPRIDDDSQSFLDYAGDGRQLVESLGSPLNVVFPERVAANVDSFRAGRTGNESSQPFRRARGKPAGRAGHPGEAPWR
jgi:hypothetical protein